MKKFILIICVLAGLSLSSVPSQAQNVQVSINIGLQPAWGPTGYKYVDYYYFPDLNVYYNVNNRFFVYFDPRGFWVESNYLPYEYERYDLYGLYKVVINHQPHPWRYNRHHYYEYAHYRGGYNQIIIRDSYDTYYKKSRKNKYRWYHSNPKKYKHTRAAYAQAPTWRDSDDRREYRRTESRSSRDYQPYRSNEQRNRNSTSTRSNQQATQQRTNTNRNNAQDNNRSRASSVNSRTSRSNSVNENRDTRRTNASSSESRSRSNSSSTSVNERSNSRSSGSVSSESRSRSNSRSTSVNESKDNRRSNAGSSGSRSRSSSSSRSSNSRSN